MKGFVTQTSPLRVRADTWNSDAPALAATGLTLAAGNEVFVERHGSEFLVVCAVSR